jgi:hydrogenase maturation factor
MAADNVVVEPGDMVLFHTGFATQILEWDRNPGSGADLHHVLVPRRA